ncbi:MAG: dihydroorotase [Flavobacteriales bacterium]|nr:dihydroorotase [Flavobacteriales bacterium]|tara:strand:+ start:5268 stop:6551 length:1284 start_codon:yes stop_codon:yes gene_type:complete
MENIKHIILRDVKIIDSSSKHNNQKKDILIIDGVIKKIDNSITISEPFFEKKSNNLHVSPGWIDLHARMGEPGLEHKETIKTGLKSAAKGGFTAVVIMPSTNPPIQSKSDVNFLIKKGQNNIVDILPTGCITKDCEQKNITEMYDMHINGAVAFTDDKKSIQNSMLMNTALEYVKNFNGLVMSTCLDDNINEFGQINEGVTSTKMGLAPSPELAEELLILRDLSILKYTNSKLHISTISSKSAINNIAKAKKNKLNISTDVAAHQLILTDELLTNFNTNLKVIPPIRDESNRKALIKGIINGTIDAISSDHTPIDIENKKCSFQQAEFGIIGLETVFPIINTILKEELELAKIIDLISKNPRQILGQKNPIIEENEIANITLFNPTQKWKYTEDEICSKSKNTPFINWEFIGKPLGVINKGKIKIYN